MIAINKFFAQWTKEMEIKCYEEDLQILPTNKPTNIYQYSESILKHMPKDSLKSFKKKHLLTVKKNCGAHKPRQTCA